MDINKIIRIKKIKYSIVKLLSFLPDNIMLRIQYYFILHRWPNINNPKRFSEWIQWYKINYHKSTMLDCTDKYNVRQYVKKNGCGDCLNELYQVCDDAVQIDFDNLPKSFVIKTTDGGNGDNIIIVHDKSKINKEDIIRKVNSWKNKKYYVISREWAYRGAKDSKIIVEKLLKADSNSDGSIDDYKFLCFNGKFKYLWIDKNRFSNHCRGFWDENLTFLDNVFSDHPTFKTPPELPSNVREMIKTAESLSTGFLFARVDLYNINKEIIFGEITFYPWSGYVKFSPDKFDFELGKEFEISHQQNMV